MQLLQTENQALNTITEQLPLRLIGQLYNNKQSQQLMQTLISEISWQKDYTAFNRKIEIPRWQAWVAAPGINYRYSDNMLNHNPWTDTLLQVKDDIEQACGHSFNSVLITYYRNGFDYVDWHADNETELGEAPYIASLSLGTERDFLCRHNTSDGIHKLTLHHGELLLMLPEFQHHWQHSIPEQSSVTKPRINLTFRYVV